MGDPFPQSCPFSWEIWTSIWLMILWAIPVPRSQYKLHDDRFSRFRTGYRRMSLYFTMGASFPKNYGPSHARSGPPSFNTWFLGLMRALFISASPSVTPPLLWTDLQRALVTSTPGCERADYDSNPTKTQVIWLCSGQLMRQVNICHVPVLSTQVKPVESACDLGVILDSQLSLSAHVAALCRSCYYQLRQLRPSEIRSLTSDAAFITCRLDYCNSLLFGVFN